MQDRKTPLPSLGEDLMTEAQPLLKRDKAALPLPTFPLIRKL